MVIDGRDKPRGNTDLVDIAVGPAAYPLDELVLVLGIPTTYVTGQRVCVDRGHRERRENGRSEKERKGEKSGSPWAACRESVLSVRESMRVFVQPRPGSAAGTSSLSGCHTVRRDVAIVRNS